MMTSFSGIFPVSQQKKTRPDQSQEIFLNVFPIGRIELGPKQFSKFCTEVMGYVLVKIRFLVRPHYSVPAGVRVRIQKFFSPLVHVIIKKRNNSICDLACL